MTLPDWLLRHGDDLQFGIFFVLLPVLMVAEWLAPRRGNAGRSTRWPTNYFLTGLNVLALGALPVSFISAAAWAEVKGFGLLHLASFPWPILVAATLGVRGFVSFGTHYLMHMVPTLWRLHRVHHLDTEVDVSTTVRVHPLEFLINLALGLPIVVGFGLTPWVLMFYELLDVAVTLWSHSNVRVPGAIDCALRYLVVTPDLHRIHHSAWKPETNSNFGAVFPLWDLVFGTFRANPRDGHQVMRLGLDEVRGRDAQRPFWLLGSSLARELRPASGRATNASPVVR